MSEDEATFEQKLGSEANLKQDVRKRGNYMQKMSQMKPYVIAMSFLPR